MAIFKQCNISSGYCFQFLSRFCTINDLAIFKHDDFTFVFEREREREREKGMVLFMTLVSVPAVILWKIMKRLLGSNS